MSNEAARLCEEGLELMTQHRWEEAEEKMKQALEEDPKSAELWYNLGKCGFHLDKFDIAFDALSEAVNLRDSYAEAWALLGSVYYATHHLESAYTAFYKASDRFQQAKNYPAQLECLTARAHTLLAQGEYEAGFAFYMERLYYKDPDTWDGTQSLLGKTLLVKAEGGLGDQIFFARYADMLGSLGAGYLLWECDAPLVEYFDIGPGRNSPGLDTVKRGDIVEHDYMVHAGSLPYIFGTKTGTIPTCGGSYFYGTLNRIGLACSGNPLHPDDHHRSIPLAAFEPLLALDKNFYLMQKDVRHTDVEAFALSGMEKPEFTDVYAMAEQIERLDLVITVDTMTAHLAGAEGIPTILLLPYACDWRWGLEGDRTPWYPSIRIFRQGEDREWGPVIQRVVEELTHAVL
jgi:tetratricopeptide (TPR) repeat protein